MTNAVMVRHDYVGVIHGISNTLILNTDIFISY